MSTSEDQKGITEFIERYPRERPAYVELGGYVAAICEEMLYRERIFGYVQRRREVPNT